jgi:hypothetical protein
MLVANMLRPSHKPLLIVSLPRSGSSWVGSILGNAANALYLREPLNQSYLATGGTTTVFDVDPRSPPKDYALFAARAFSGMPVFPDGVVRNAANWALFSRLEKGLVIKEVNPLALPWLLETYRPRIIYLVRHPAAVASSYWKLGWRNAEEKLLELGPRLMNGPLKQWQDVIRSASGFWQAQGVFQGAVMRIAIDSLASYGDYQIVSYEAICSAPEGNLLELLDFSRLTVDESIRQKIADSSHGSERHGQNEYATRRSSLDMAQAWRSKVNEEQLAMLQAGFSAFKLPFYDSADDWMIK